MPVTVPQSAQGAPGRIARRNISLSSLGYLGDTPRMMRTRCSRRVVSFRPHAGSPSLPPKQHSVRFKWRIRQMLHSSYIVISRRHETAHSADAYPRRPRSLVRCAHATNTPPSQPSLKRSTGLPWSLSQSRTAPPSIHAGTPTLARPIRSPVLCPQRQMRPEELSKLPLALHTRRGAKGLGELAQSHRAHVSQKMEALDDLRRAEVAERERL